MPLGGKVRDPHLSELYGQIAPIMDHARQIAGAMNPDQLKWKPSPRAWSVGDCLEHLVVTADVYCDCIEPVLKTAVRPRELQPWRPSFLGKVLIKGVTTSRRLKRPRRFAPPRKPRRDVLDAFLKSHERLAELVRAADGVDLSRTTVSSPVGRLFRLNLGDCFTLLVHHAKRHLHQAARVAESRRLPRPDRTGGATE
jgi:hypothetical protein